MNGCCLFHFKISVSQYNDGVVWGVDKNEDVFRRVGNSWERIDGKVMQVSVGYGGVWAVASDQKIYYRKGTFGVDAT